MKKILILVICLYVSASYAQSVVIDPNQTTILDAQGTDKTARLPLMTSFQRAAIVAPKLGSMVYDTDFKAVFMFDGQNWNPLAMAASLNSLPPINRTASDGTAGDNFGSSVAISGDYAIVGAMNDDGNKGAAYIFTRSNGSWIEQAKLTASDAAAADYFGTSVSINGDYAIVGASSDDIGINTNQGSAYIFVRSGTTWTEQAKLLGDDSNENDFFGVSVSIDGDYAIIGAGLKENGSKLYQGVAYVFNRSGNSWIQQAKLISPDGDAGDGFGSSVSISGDYIIVGAVGDDSGTGSVYIFVRSGTSWAQQSKLMASDGVAHDNFGGRVSISGNYAITGVPNVTIGSNPSQGAVYLFQRIGSVWSQVSKLTAPDATYAFQFGRSVSISGDYIIAGATGKDVGPNIDQGSAYIFTHSGGTWSVVDASGQSYEYFGMSSAISSTGAFVVGASSKDNQKGSVSFGKAGN